MLFWSDHFEIVCLKVDSRLEFIFGSSGGERVAGNTIPVICSHKLRTLSKTANQYWREHKIAKGTAT